MQHLQGNLQTVFDALYSLGIIDPVLKMDWQAAMSQRDRFAAKIDLAVETVNRYGHDAQELASALEEFDDEVLTYLAMEVAREFADFHARKEIH